MGQTPPLSSLLVSGRTSVLSHMMVGLKFESGAPACLLPPCLPRARLAWRAAVPLPCARLICGCDPCLMHFPLAFSPWGFWARWVLVSRAFDGQPHTGLSPSFHPLRLPLLSGVVVCGCCRVSFLVSLFHLNLSLRAHLYGHIVQVTVTLVVSRLQ